MNNLEWMNDKDYIGYTEMMRSAEVVISEEDKQTLLDLLGVCDRILDKYPRNNNSHCSYMTKMSRAKDGIKDAKTWCEALLIDKKDVLE